MPDGDEIHDFRDLVAWQRAMQLAILVDEICDKLMRKHWDVAAQLRRSSNSVHLNIAEGNGRGTIPDYLRHLSISHSSLNETESNLYFVNERYRSRVPAAEALDLVVGVRKPLLGLVKSLKRKRDSGG